MNDFFGYQTPDALNESLWSLLFCSTDSSECTTVNFEKNETVVSETKRVSVAGKIAESKSSPLWSYCDDRSGFSPACVSMMPRSFVEPLEGEICSEGEIA
jgi:hypothetical protein